jgi:hypothetical protein
MARSPNAQIAVELYRQLCDQHHWTTDEAWKGIALLLLTCDIQPSKRTGWRPFFDIVVYRDSNDFKKLKGGRPNRTLTRGEELTSYLAREVGVTRDLLCSEIGKYWQHRAIRKLQYHNLVGHGFRSIVVEILTRFGAPGIRYEEEVKASDLFPGHTFPTRSRKAKCDIVAWKGQTLVAIVTTRWRFRTDRPDAPDEAMAYVPAARRGNPAFRFYVVTGEFDPSRLGKLLAHAPPASANPSIASVIHFNPALIVRGLGLSGDGGEMNHLRDLAHLVAETHTW